MTTENDLIVDEMIARLRALQGSGEFPPLTRSILAGEGLEGGGTLEDDRTLAIDAATRQLLAELEARGDLDALATTDEVADALQSYVRSDDAKPIVSYRDFTVTDPPATTVNAPPLRIDVPSVLERVSVTVGTPSAQQVNVTVAGQSVTVPAGNESVSVALGQTLGAETLLRLQVAATSASGIVVSLRIREV